MFFKAPTSQLSILEDLALLDTFFMLPTQFGKQACLRGCLCIDKCVCTCEVYIHLQVLKSMGINLKDARHETEKIIGRGSGFVAVEIPFTPRAKRVLELSLEEARQLGRPVSLSLRQKSSSKLGRIDNACYLHASISIRSIVHILLPPLLCGNLQSS